MIIGSLFPCRIGQTVTAVCSESPNTLGEGTQEQPCMVVRRATLDEWATQIRSADNSPEEVEQALKNARDAFFYEVSTD